MKRTQQTMPAIVTELPRLHTFVEPDSGHFVDHLAYEAEMQYVRKDPETRFILCSSLSDVELNEPVLVSYHCGMRAYQHATHVAVSSLRNCYGGFYYTNGESAE